MSFLAPIFLLGAVAVALPVLFHLTRRTTRDKQPFSSLLFLETTPPRFTRRSRLQHLLLLTLRAAAICLLAGAFARPFFVGPVDAPRRRSQPQATVLLLDTSASMRRDGLWTEAVERAGQWLRRLQAHDPCTLLTFDDAPRSVFGFKEWEAADPPVRLEAGLRWLRQLSPGWGATRLDDALIRAADALAELDEGTSRARRIVLISDFQEGAHRQGLQGHAWPQGVEVVIESVQPRTPGNAGLHVVPTGVDSPAREGTLQIRVLNSADARAESFLVNWDARPGATGVVVHVPAGGSRVVSLPSPAPGMANAQVILTGDEAGFDNRVFVTAAQPAERVVHCLSRENAEDPATALYYLKRAFSADGERPVRVVVGLSQSTTPAVRREHLLVAAQPLSDAEADVLRQHALEGGLALLVPGAGDRLTALGRLLGREIPELAEGAVPAAGYVLLGEIQFGHPVFAPFADSRYSDFTKIHFWKYRRLSAEALPGARVLARFDSGDPAMLEVSLGRGQVLVLTSSWRPEDSELARSTKFVPLLHSLLDQAAGGTARAVPARVGDELRLAGEDAKGEHMLRLPDGRQIVLAAGENRYGPLAVPGVYEVTSASDRWSFAVNLDPAESRTAPLAVEELEQLGVPAMKRPRTAETPTAQTRFAPLAELEDRQKLWRGLLLGVLALVLGETCLAAVLTRRASRERV